MNSQFAWNNQEQQFRPNGYQSPLNKGDRTMAKKDVKSYQLTRKSGRVDNIRFTGKREQILNMMLEGKSNDDVVAAGFSKNTVLVVRWQGNTLGLLQASEGEAGAGQEATTEE